MADDLWVFGYGSLVWRPDFDHAERRPAFVADWARRFWQGSTDHRGLPDSPGRVVTLVSEVGALCWGMAYRVVAAERQGILARLDHRESGGYERRELELHFPDGAGGGDRAARGITYLATPRNRNYLGPASMSQIAAQVKSSHGPSGSNLEYVLRLAEALRALGAQDDHVFDLEALLGGEAN